MSFVGLKDSPRIAFTEIPLKTNWNFGPKKFFSNFFLYLKSNVPIRISAFWQYFWMDLGHWKPPMKLRKIPTCHFGKNCVFACEMPGFLGPNRGLKYSEKIKMFKFFSSLLLGYFNGISDFWDLFWMILVYQKPHVKLKRDLLYGQIFIQICGMEKKLRFLGVNFFKIFFFLMFEKYCDACFFFSCLKSIVMLVFPFSASNTHSQVVVSGCGSSSGFLTGLGAFKVGWKSLIWANFYTGLWYGEKIEIFWGVNFFKSFFFHHDLKSIVMLVFPFSGSNNIHKC